MPAAASAAAALGIALFTHGLAFLFAHVFPALAHFLATLTHFRPSRIALFRAHVVPALTLFLTKLFALLFAHAVPALAHFLASRLVCRLELFAGGGAFLGRQVVERFTVRFTDLVALLDRLLLRALLLCESTTTRQQRRPTDDFQCLSS